MTPILTAAPWPTWPSREPKYQTMRQYHAPSPQSLVQTKSPTQPTIPTTSVPQIWPVQRTIHRISAEYILLPRPFSPASNACQHSLDYLVIRPHPPPPPPSSGRTSTHQLTILPLGQTTKDTAAVPEAVTGTGDALPSETGTKRLHHDANPDLSKGHQRYDKHVRQKGSDQEKWASEGGQADEVVDGVVGGR